MASDLFGEVPPPPPPDPRYVEQGISVWDMDDGYEEYAGRTFAEAFECALRNWCGPDGPEDPMDRDNYDEAADEHALHLDANMINIADEGAPSQLISYREQIRKMIAAGTEFPAFFCGCEG